ncbi:NAD(P)-dependent oxidoreductase [Winogradskya humida]|uniref:NAD-dependent dehydratase n=1 Tax=Winogradskya humida TaxID=113566 RepID=A0ABQ3ZSS4_9ACTN|nr:NAD(P)H-binding protein [Actinoplanes humidus]GIE21632.1 NAD-dependent dehydratase [Actinoplanes humidus]
MKIAVLGSTGKTGRLLVSEALRQGHDVVAIARTPAKLVDLEHERLTVIAADVFAPAGFAAATQDAGALVSALGTARGGDVTTLTAGADAVAALRLPKVVWLGSLGLGATGGSAGPLFTPLFNLVLRKEIPAKTAAENTIRAAGGTVVHAPILGGNEPKGTFELVPAATYRPPLMFPTITRADVAALMIEEAAKSRFGNETAVFARR